MIRPRNPAFAADVAASFARQGALQAIGAVLATGHVVRAGRKLIVTRMEVAALDPQGRARMCAVA